MIQITALKKSYPNQSKAALGGVSLTVNTGETIAIMGQSGCGKTTLLNIIAGLDTFDSGEVSILNHQWESLSEDQKTEIRKSEMGFIFQFFNLLPTLTIEENILLPLALINTPKAEQKIKLATIAEQVGITEKLQAYPSQLSGGQMQRAAIARALIHQPKLILADEPTGNLDTETSEEILNLLEELCKANNHTLLMVTHNIEATRIAKRLIQMKDGHIIRDQVTG